MTAPPDDPDGPPARPVTPPMGFAPPEATPRVDPHNPFAPPAYPPYAQPPYAQPPYAQPPYAQPPYAQPPYGQAAPGYYPGYPPYGYPPPPPPRRPRTGLWVAVGAVSVALMLGCCGMGMSGLAKLRTPASSAGSGRSLPTPDSGDEDSEVSVKRGESVRYDDLEFLISAPPDCKAGAAGQPGKQITPTNGQFCNVRIRVTNRGNVEETWTSNGATAFTQREEDGVEPRADVAWAWGEITGVSIVPGQSTTVLAVFDMEPGDHIEYVGLSSGGSTTKPVYVDM